MDRRRRQLIMTIMRRILTVVVVSLVTFGSARPALAQSGTGTEKLWFSVSGGVQPTPNNFSDAFDLPLYVENEHVTVDYPVKSGAVIAASGGYRVWKRLEIGLGVTRYNRRGSSAVSAELPHPFFDNQFRHVEGTASTTRNEVGAHLLIGWMMPLTDKLRVLVTAGPSFFSVGHTLVTDVQFSETFPFDTATFTGVTTKDASATAAGFNAGADVFWMFSHNLGAGGLVQFTRASVRENAGNSRTISVDAGGAQVGAGIRFVF
jgi:hypothetical protein